MSPFLGEVDVLVKFEKAWVECQVFYNQPGITFLERFQDFNLCVIVQNPPFMVELIHNFT